MEERHWQMSLTPVELSPEGRPGFILARSVDLTAQVLAERASQDARMRLEAIVTAAEIGTWIWEVRNNQVFADRNLARLFNVSEADARGGPIDHYMAHVHEEDRARVTEEINRATAEGVPFETEYRVARPEGDYRWVVARGWAERDPATGEAVRFPGVVLDITERRRAQEAARAGAEHLRMALDATRLGTWEYRSRHGHLELVGRLPRHVRSVAWCARDLRAVVPRRHPPGRPRQDERGGATRALDPAGDGFYNAEFRTVGIEDGVERWVAARGKAFFDAAGHCERFIGTTLDITEAKRAEHAAARRSEQCASSPTPPRGSTPRSTCLPCWASSRRKPAS